MDLEKAVREGNVYNPDFVTPSKGEEIVADMTLQDSKERKYLIQAENGNSTARTKAEQARAKWRRDALDLLAIAGNDRIPCPHGCSGRGQCVHGLCQCKEGWHTADCSERSCPRNCSGHGSCMDGFVNVKTNGLDLTVQSNQHQNVKKHVLRHAKRIVQKVMTAQMQDNVVLKIVLKRIATHRNLTFVVYHQWKAW